MKFTSFTFAFVLLFVAVFVGAVPGPVVVRETNADRFARGLPPLAPARRNPAETAPRRGQPSATPGGSCNAGPVQCCNSVQNSNSLSGTLRTILRLLGIAIPGNVDVGVTCSPISVLGVGHNTCSSQPVCCQNNNYNGVVAIGCSPINL